MSDVFQEIDEEVRQDQLKLLWDRWGLIFVGTIVSIILAWTGWILWRDHVEATRAAESTAFEAAIAADGAGLAALDQLTATAESGYAAIAAFHKAGLLLERGQPLEAVDVYDAVAADSTTNSRLRGLASLLAAMVLADADLTDQARARLQPLAVDGGDWALSARETLALQDFRAGDLDAAESAFSDLSTGAGTPGAMRQRAREMLDLIDASRAPGAVSDTLPGIELETPPEVAPEVSSEEEDPS